MTVFGFRLKARFWWIIGALTLVFIAWMIVSSTRTPPPDPLSEPAFPLQQLSKLSDNWIQPYVAQWGIRSPASNVPFADLSANSGTAFRFRAYIPPPDVAAERPDLDTSRFGWRFVPAVFISTTERIPVDDLGSKDEELLDGRPLMIGFRQGSVPATGVYELTALLYGPQQVISDLDPNATLSSPILLASSALERPLSPLQLEAPATHRADLNIIYEQGNYRLNIKSVEWASGQQVRLCTEILNSGSNVPLPSWDGINGFRAEYPQAAGSSSDGSTDPLGPLANQDLLDKDVGTRGYIQFTNAPLRGPEDGMTLFVPALNADGAGAPTIIKVAPDQFRDTQRIDLISSGNSADGC